MRCKLITIAFFLLVFNPSFFALGAQGDPGQAEIEIWGKVVDEKGNPIPEATVVVLDWSLITYEVHMTNLSGYYHVSVPKYDELGEHEYIIYVWHEDPETGAIDYVPSLYPEDIYASDSMIRESCEVSLRLHAAATIVVEGGLWYVLSREAPRWFTFEVISAISLAKPNLGDPYISVYGNPPFQYECGPDSRYIPGEIFNKSYVVVPAGIPICIEVRVQFKSERKGMVGITFLVDENGEPFTLSQGKLTTVNIQADSYLFSVEEMWGVVKEVEDAIVEAENIGFFMGAERDDLRKISNLIKEAERKLNEGALPKARNDLEGGYAQIGFLETRIATMYALVQSHACFFPFFFAVFVVILAFFLFEKGRKKIISALILYPVMIGALFFIYPGFMLISSMDVTINLYSGPIMKLVFTVPGAVLFPTVAVLAIAATLIVFFLFPRIFRPPKVEGKTSLMSILSVIFSMGKRNVRRRKLRSIFCMVAIMILVLCFTALTSFARVEGFLVEGPSRTNVLINGVLLQKIPPNETNIRYPQHFFTELEVEGLKEYGVNFSVPKAENLPSATPILSVRSLNGKSMPIYGVIGIQPSDEEEITQVSNYIVDGKLEDNATTGIALSQKLAQELGVTVGDPLQVYNITAMVPKFCGNFTLVGYLADSIFGLSDINGRSFVPFKYKDTKIEKVNEMETVIFTLQTALNVHRGSVGISRVFVYLLDSSEQNIDEFAMSMVFRHYTAWTFSDGRLTKYFIGETFEVRGFEQFIVPFLLVALNVSAVMLNVVYERRGEVYMLSVLGLNPAHIASLFLAESMVMGYIGGGIGYFLGLGTYRLMTLLGPSGQLEVRAKLEWYWGVIGVAIALFVAVLSALRPAMRAAALSAPSLVKKVKLAEPERREREKELFKAYLASEYSMPIKVHEMEEPFFFSYIIDRLKELTGRHYERIEDLTTDEQITPDGTHIKKISFTYTFTEEKTEYSTVNELVAKKGPKVDYYSMFLSSKPKVSGLPERVIEVTVSFVSGMLRDWEKRRK